MTALAQRQADFLANVLDDAAPLPAGWGERHAAGLSVYRNNYRSALVEALRDTFERTERLVGEDAFRRAAAHHVIAHPPSGWTLDHVALGFDETCRDLFADDPDVGELAALELAMFLVFTAPDQAPIDGPGFAEATAAFGEDDWSGFGLSFMPGLTVRTAAFDLVRLWKSLAEGSDGALAKRLAEPASVIVWREGEQPTFIMASAYDGEAIAALQRGATYGAVVAELSDRLGEARAVEEAGAMLGRWLQNGMIAAIAR